MSGDWVKVMSNEFWKFLLSTSRIALAKPHMKNSVVMSMNGTM